MYLNIKIPISFLFSLQTIQACSFITNYSYLEKALYNKWYLNINKVNKETCTNVPTDFLLPI